jgi:hypothetical protein
MYAGEGRSLPLSGAPEITAVKMFNRIDPWLESIIFVSEMKKSQSFWQKNAEKKLRLLPAFECSIFKTLFHIFLKI